VVDFDDPSCFALFLELYGALPRAAPGSDSDTRRAVSLLPCDRLSSVLDLGCGPGTQTLSLAHALPEAGLVAIDLLPFMAAEARRLCDDSAVGRRVTVAVADMAAPPVPLNSQDLIWCEGAIYNIGVTAALRRWKDLLLDTGYVAFTEPIWLQDDPHAEIREWWSREYPAMTDAEGIGEAISAAGYELITSFVLPPDTWWQDYYHPLEQSLEGFRKRHEGDRWAGEIADMADEEIRMCRRHGDAYGYAFFIVRPAR
jgi:trans-aconitate methyltransferase